MFPSGDQCSINENDPKVTSQVSRELGAGTEGLSGLEEAGKVPTPTEPADGCQGEGEERKVCVVWVFFGVCLGLDFLGGGGECLLFCFFKW